MSGITRSTDTSTVTQVVQSGRYFLGWERPVLPEAVRRLFSLYCQGSQWDMRRVLIVLPGGLATRRLRELLAVHAHQSSCLLYPPEMVTVGALPERLYMTKKPLASDLVQTLAWSAALQSSPISELRLLVPNPPPTSATGQWLELARIMAKLHAELASDCLDFAKVAKALGKNHVEAPRWNALSKIQRHYLDELHELDLWDVQTARLRALESNEAATDRQIIVIGCVDLNRVQRGFLNAISSQVQIWVAAPQSLDSSFDPLGCLEAQHWQGQDIQLPDDCLLVGNSPSDQAELVATSLAEWGSKLHVREVTLGVPDSTLIPEIRNRLLQSDLKSRFGPGTPLTQSSTAVLLALISQYIDQRDFASLAALVRHPVVESMLSDSSKQLPVDWLSRLDDYYKQALPAQLDGFVAEAHDTARAFRAVTEAVAHWLKPLDRRARRVTRWAQPIRSVLSIALQYVRPMAQPADLSGDTNAKWIDSTAQIGNALSGLENIPEKLQPKMSLPEVIDWLLQSISNVLVPETPDPLAVEMLGWLELAWDDAPALVIVGLHDGVVPESVSADAFLPNQLRRQLGMLDNTRRMARDIYLMQTILSTREFIRIVVGKTDVSGDPLVPSRLLLACDLSVLPARVLHLVEEEYADVLPTVERLTRPVSGPSRLPIPRPEISEPPFKISVTAFRDYLRCPYRFYLRHVRELRSTSDALVELDASMFGNIVHYTLDRLGGSNVGNSTDAEEVAEFLRDQLQQVVLGQLGPNPPAAAMIQIEQAQMRLAIFAQRQAARAAEGWQIRFTETGCKLKDGVMIGQNKELCLIGRIDRIDFHPENGEWAIWDYKTSETAKKPISVHYSRRDGWLDLQLPLYIPIARHLGVTGTPSVGYIALPKRLDDVNFYPAEFDQSMLKEALDKADEVATNVARCEFWPESIEPVDYDDFARICQIGSQQVHAAEPRRRLFRFDSYRDQQVDPQIVREARQRLDNPSDRAAIHLEPLLIRASAGTGKTFQLSNRLLHILLSGHDVDGILATTFTRKAAGEIMRRVLQRLATGCISQEEREQLATHLPEVDCSAAACLATLRRVTASIHRLRISTLDSFFSQLARTFSLEMGLPAGWSTMEPSQVQNVQMQAISEMMHQNDRQTVTELVRMLFKGDSNRRVSDDIRSTVEGGLTLFRGSNESAWDRLPLRPEPEESAYRSAISTLENCRLMDKRIDGSIEKLRTQVSQGDWDGLLRQKLIACVKSDVPTYYKKELPRELVVALRLLADKAVFELLPIYRTQTLATYRILQAYDHSYQDLLRRKRALAFADVAHFLAKWLETSLLARRDQSGLAQLEHRMDSSVQHLLLDEFQDTSLEQWEILRPIAQPLASKEQKRQRATGDDQSFFCVGDSKQAIYGWRGGVAEIFDNVQQTIAGIKGRDLKKSYRSSPQIMQVVNKVFTNLRCHSNFGDCDAAAQLWQDHFPEHETDRNLQAGYVLLENGPRPDDKQLTSDQQRVNFLAHSMDRVAELVAKTSASIGILVRTNKDVASVIALLRERNIAGSQDGGNPLTDSAAVELILSLVHLADHPGDTICAFHVRSSPLFADLRAVVGFNETGDWAIQLGLWFAHLVSLKGLGQAIQWVAQRLSRHLSWWDQQRVEQLIRVAFEHHQAGGRLREFEDFIENHRVALPTDSQVKVMTIHKSKGLEFDAVFLPAMDQELSGATPLLVARRPGPCQPPDGVLRYMNSELQSWLPPDWQQAFHAVKASQVYESLCTLYVAMTRAKQALYITTCAAGKEPRQDVGSLLHATLAGSTELAAKPLAELFSLGDPEWYADKHKQSKGAQGRASARLPSHKSKTSDSSDKTDTSDKSDKSRSLEMLAIQLVRQPSQASLRGLRVRAPSQAGSESEFGASEEGVAKCAVSDTSGLKRVEQVEYLREGLSQALATNAGTASIFGKLIHFLLARVGWLEEFSMDRSQLTQVAGTCLLPDELRQVSIPDVLDYFESALANGELRKMLSRSRYWKTVGGVPADEIVVETERPVCAICDGQLVVGTIDRLVVLLAHGTPVAAEVIDYKTDSPEGQPRLLWNDETVRRHRSQLELYGRVVSELYGIEESLVGKNLVMLATGEVLQISS